jgi:alkylhydroperoxidase/carboxymuconolactone decarboxylase family protein YurZ
MAMPDDFLKRGRDVQEQLTGDSLADRPRPDSETLVPELRELSDEANWGRIWARDGLDLRTRSLCVITCLLTLGHYKQAFGQMQGARRIGVTQDELAEVVLQLTFYAGLPVVHEGLALVKRAFDEPLPS